MCYVMGGTCVFLLCLFASMEMPWALLLTCCFSARLFMMGATCLMWVSTLDFLATEIRSTGHAAANAISRGSRRCHYLSFYCLGTYTSAGDWMYHAVCGSRDCSFRPQASYTYPRQWVKAWALRRLPREKPTPLLLLLLHHAPLRNCYASTELSTLTVTPTRVPTREIL
jgi:hypothetical protein